jgi:GAF domain-containing protein
MNFLRNKQLRQLGAYLLLLTVIVFVIEFFIVEYKISTLEEAERKIEFTQVAQLSNHKITLLVQHYLNGRSEVAPQIAAAIDQQEYKLKTLAIGGRLDDRSELIKPLSRLPKITFDALRENWVNYKESVFELVGAEKTEETIQPDTTVTDSVKIITTSSQPVVKRQKTASLVRVQYEGLSLTMANWYDRLIVDLEDELKTKKAGLDRWRIFFLIFNLSMIGGAFYLFQRNVLQPLSLLEHNTANHKQSQGFDGNEIGKVAKNVNETIENLKDATEFVLAIGKGDLGLNYKETLDKNYVPGNNILADSLINMQSKLRELNEEDEKRRWANEGLAKFVDILRSSNDNIHALGDKIISGLIHYTKSNQGALYILNDEDEANKYLELISLFAFDIKKHEQQRIKPGQGILGQTFLERETTYLTQIPEEYVRITSGLGGANPKAILIVPLKLDKDVYGLVELASFEEYASHEIAFVEKLGETIASTLGSVRAAQKNKQLIEQFQQQTEEMRAQEEEMRQNMEELQATQEEIVRKEKSYLARIQELEETLSAKESDSTLSLEIEKMNIREKEYMLKVEQLQKELAAKPLKGDDWQIASEIENELRVQLEMLRITHDEMKKKRG